MKKMMIVMSMALSAVAFATPNAEAIAFAQRYADNVATNGLGGRWLIPAMTNDAETAAAVDDILSTCAKPPSGKKDTMAPYFPKTWQAFLAKIQPTYPVLAAHLSGQKLASDKTVWASFWFELCDNSLDAMATDFNRLEKSVLDAASAAIRRQLRSQGKSIVTKDGVNPVQVELDKVSACLNAPRFNGLSAVLQSYGANIHVIDFHYAPSGDALTSLTNAIYIGDEPFNPKNQVLLRYSLGLEEYNRFVQEYNK